eukprot:4083981-Prymnesium_polylepis.1
MMLLASCVLDVLAVLPPLPVAPRVPLRTATRAHQQRACPPRLAAAPSPAPPVPAAPSPVTYQLPLRLPSTAELLLVTCKVARLPEVQNVPRSLRLRSTYELVACAFEELPSVYASSSVLFSGGDPCLQWDELIEQLSKRLEEQSAPGSLSRSQHEELIRAVVEVIFGDSLVAEMTDEMIAGVRPQTERSEAGREGGGRRAWPQRGDERKGGHRLE